MCCCRNKFVVNEIKCVVNVNKFVIYSNQMCCFRNKFVVYTCFLGNWTTWRGRSCSAWITVSLDTTLAVGVFPFAAGCTAGVGFVMTHAFAFALSVDVFSFAFAFALSVDFFSFAFAFALSVDVFSFAFAFALSVDFFFTLSSSQSEAESELDSPSSSSEVVSDSSSSWFNTAHRLQCVASFCAYGSVCYIYCMLYILHAIYVILRICKYPNPNPNPNLPSGCTTTRQFLYCGKTVFVSCRTRPPF